eukprot:4036345-Pyramimonas_sp.AAC.1
MRLLYTAQRCGRQTRSTTRKMATRKWPGSAAVDLRSIPSKKACFLCSGRLRAGILRTLRVKERVR